MNSTCFWSQNIPVARFSCCNIKFKQVGIVGRTGAGKSSILNALFRLTPISGGCVLVDGINIIDIPVRDLRAHLSVVPQSPFLFEGSLRYVYPT